MFKAMGAKRVKILNGPLAKWIKEGKPIDSTDPEESKQTARGPQTITDMNYIFKNNVLFKYEHFPINVLPVVDSRDSAEFAQGTVANAISLPYESLLNEDYSFKSKDEIAAAFKSASINKPHSEALVLSCNRGVTACALDIALRELGNTNSRMYDGSWTEYKARKTQGK